MTIEKFAETYRVRVRLDECGDRIIPGSRGHLYFDGGQLCLMALERRGRSEDDNRLRALGGDFWSGTVFRNERNRAYRDVSLRGIPEEHWKKAIRAVGIRVIRTLTPEELERLARIRPQTQ